MMRTGCWKHVEAWNKYIKKECIKLVITENRIKMHGQQNTKKIKLILGSSTTEPFPLGKKSISRHARNIAKTHFRLRCSTSGDAAKQV
jgi:hypothetical protein